MSGIVVQFYYDIIYLIDINKKMDQNGKII